MMKLQGELFLVRYDRETKMFSRELVDQYVSNCGKYLVSEYLRDGTQEFIVKILRTPRIPEEVFIDPNSTRWEGFKPSEAQIKFHNQMGETKLWTGFPARIKD